MAEDTLAAAVEPSPEPQPVNARSLLFGDTAQILFHGGLLLCAALFLVALPFFTRDGTQDFVHDLLQHAFVLFWMLLATSLTRTIGLRTLAAFFFLGLFPAVLLVQVLGRFLDDFVGTGRMFDSFAVPILEEAAKAAPVAIFFWYAARRGRQMSMTDGLLLGFVIGAGMAIHEDVLYSRVYGLGWDGSILGWIFPTIGEESTLSRVEVYGLYHSGWGSLSGLAIGAWFMLRHRYRWAALIAVVGFLVVVLDHAIGNFIIENEGAEDLGLLWTLDMNGYLPIVLLLVGIPAAIAAELVILSRGAGDEEMGRTQPLSALSNLGGAGGPLKGLMDFQAARLRERARRSSIYFLWARERLSPEQT